MDNTVKVKKCYLWCEQMDQDTDDIESVWNDDSVKKMQKLLQNKFKSIDKDHEVLPDAFKYVCSGNPGDTTLQMIESLNDSFTGKEPTTQLLKMYNSGMWMFISWLYPHHNFMCVFGFRTVNDPSVSVWDEETIYTRPRVRRYMSKRLELNYTDQPNFNRLITFIKLPNIKHDDTEEFSSDEDLDQFISEYNDNMRSFMEKVNQDTEDKV
ncbi:hypothetical protein [Salmon gill poxvirus]